MSLLVFTIPLNLVHADEKKLSPTQAHQRASAAIELGREYLYNDDYLDTYEYFKTAVKRFPNDARVYFWLTVSAERASSLPALEAFLKVSLADNYSGELNPSMSRYALALLALSKPSVTEDATDVVALADALGTERAIAQAKTAQALLEPAIKTLPTPLNNSGASVMVLLAKTQFQQGNNKQAVTTLYAMHQRLQREREIDTGVCFHHSSDAKPLPYLTKREWQARSNEQVAQDLLTRCESALPEAWRLWNMLDAVAFLQAYHTKTLKPSALAGETMLQKWDKAWLTIAEYAVFHGNKDNLQQLDKLLQESELQLQRLMPKATSSLLTSLERLSQTLQSSWQETVEKPAGTPYLLRRQQLLITTGLLIKWAKQPDDVTTKALNRHLATVYKSWPKKQDLESLASMLSLTARVALRQRQPKLASQWLRVLIEPLREMKRPVALLSVYKTLALNAYAAKEKGQASNYTRALQYTLIDNKLIKRQRKDFLVVFPPWLMYVFLGALALLILLMSLVSLRYVRRMKVKNRGLRFASRIWLQAMIAAGNAMTKMNRRWSIIFALAAFVYIAVLWALYASGSSSYAAIYPFTGVWPNVYLWFTLLILYICVAYIRIHIGPRHQFAADIDNRLKTRGVHEAWLVHGNGDDNGQKRGGKGNSKHESLLAQRMKATLAEPTAEKYWAVDAVTVHSIGAVLVLLGLLLSLNQLPMPEMKYPVIPEFDECNKLQPPPKKNEQEEKLLELQRLERTRRKGDDGARGRTGLDVNVQPVPDSMVSKLSETTSVGGLDVKGEAFDYYTNFPERDWQYPREDIAPSAAQQAAPGAEFEAIQHEPIQYIPSRYKGRWQDYKQDNETNNEDSP